MKHTRLIVASAMLSVMAQAVAQAASGQDSETEEDSVYRWGRWRVLTPAAGLQDVGIHIPHEYEARPEDAEEYSRKLSDTGEGTEGQDGGSMQEGEETGVQVPEGSCEAGAPCGYATYRRSYYGEFVQVPLDTGPEPARFELSINPGGGEGSVTGSFDVTGVDDDLFPDRHSVDPLAGSRNFLGSDDSEGYEYFLDEWETTAEGNEHESEIDPGFQIPVSHGTGHASTYWRDRIWNYGEDGCYGVGTCFEDTAQGEFVYGVTSPAEDLDALNAGNVTAVYEGFTINATPVPVRIEVRFGPEPTWSGSWNLGRDGHVSIFTDSRGQLYVEGEVGFEAAGHVSGPNIISDAISARDGTVTGTVRGSFVGRATGAATATGAPYLIGISDIVKTRDGVEKSVEGVQGAASYQKARNVSTFAAGREGVAVTIRDLD